MFKKKWRFLTLAKLSKDELVAKIRAHFGDAPSDEELEIIEDISDSITGGADADAIRAATEEVEKKWRKKYADRFLGKKPEEEEAVLPILSDPETLPEAKDHASP